MSLLKKRQSASFRLKHNSPSSQAGGKYSIDITKWKETLGPVLFAKIIIALIDINRLHALADLMMQSTSFNKGRTDARGARNRFASFALSVGILHQMYQTLQSLSGEMKKKNPIIHRKIIEIIKDFDKSPLKLLIKNFRNVTFHNVDEKTIIEGLDKLGTNSVDFVTFETGKLGDTYYGIADEASILGFYGELFAKSKEKNFEKFYKKQLKEFMLYISTIQTNLLPKIDALVLSVIDEFQLEMKVITFHKGGT